MRRRGPHDRPPPCSLRTYRARSKGDPTVRARGGRGRRGGREQGEAEDEGGRQVAQARLEAARHPLRARGRGRRDQPGEAAARPARPATASTGRHPLRARRSRRGTTEALEGKDQAGQGGEERAAARRSEAVVEAGQEPVRPDRAVGQVAEDAVRLRGRRAPGRGPAARSGRGCRTRAAGCRCGRGCAGTSSRRPPGPRGPAPPAPSRRRPRGATAARPTTRTAAGSRKLSLVPAARPAARPARTRAPVGRPPAAPRRLRRRPAVARGPGVEGDRNSSEQEEDPDDVVPRLPRLVGERRNAQRDRPECQRPRRHPVRPPDAPARDQAAHEPAEVQQRREQVPSNAFIPIAWKHLRVGRVEPSQELRRDVVQVPGVPALHEPCRERPVVPGAIEPGHPCVELQLDLRRRNSRPLPLRRPGRQRSRMPDAPSGGSCQRIRGGCGQLPRPP